MSKTYAVAADRLQSFVIRIEKLIEERKAIQSDIKDVFSEAKGVGYDVAALRKVIVLRAMDPADRAEMESLIDTYMHALGDGKRAAVEAMQKGAGTREAARVAGIAVGSASQLRTGVHGIGNGERVHETQNDERNKGVDFQGQAGVPSEPRTDAAQATLPPPAGVSGDIFAGESDCSGDITQNGGDDSQKAKSGEEITLGANETGHSGHDSPSKEIISEISCGQPDLGSEAGTRIETVAAPGPHDTSDDGLSIPPFLKRDARRVEA